MINAPHPPKESTAVHPIDSAPHFSRSKQDFAPGSGPKLELLAQQRQVSSASSLASALGPAAHCDSFLDGLLELGCHAYMPEGCRRRLSTVQAMSSLLNVFGSATSGNCAK